MTAEGNGGTAWQRWLLGIGATILASLVINGIAFQRDVRQGMSENKVRIDNLERRDENIIKFLQQRINEHGQLLEQRLEQIEKRLPQQPYRPQSDQPGSGR